MSSDSKLYEAEDSLKKKYHGIIKELSHVELKQFNQLNYKLKVLEDISTLLPNFNKSRLDDTAQCVSNFLQSEVKELLRKKSRESRKHTAALLSDTIVNELNNTMELPVSEANADQNNTETGSIDEEIDGDLTTVLDDSITQLKQTASAKGTDKTPNAEPYKSTREESSDTKCSDTCQVRPTTKRKYDMIRCSVCAHWFHEACVGIAKGEPVGIWLCNACKSIPTSIKHDISDMKSEINGLKECTQNILKAVLDMSTKFESNFGSLNDRITALTRQINGKDLVITESLEQLQTSTNTLKTSLDQKSCKIINQTTAVLEKVKAHSDNNKTNTKTKQTPYTNETLKTNNSNQNVATNESEKSEVHTSVSDKKRFRKPKRKNTNSNPSSSKQSYPKNQKGKEAQTASNTDEIDNYIDLTKETKKHIKQKTLLVGSSILKGVKTNQLNSETAVRSFPGATTVSLREKLRDYDIDNCKTIILHVGGNDADNGDSLDSFCDNYIELLESLASDDRRLIVSGLLPRKSVDLEPYNDTLRSLCAENDTEFVDNYQNFLLASGEIPASYFWKDKVHLNQHGTIKLVTSIDRVCKIKGSTPPEHNGPKSKGPFMRPRRMGAPRVQRSPHRVSRYCHICLTNSHTTQQCWYNGRSSGMPERSFESYH